MATVLARRYQASLAELRRRAALGVGRAWTSLDSYDERDVPTFVDRAVPIVGAAQRNAAGLTDAFMARAARGRVLGLAADAGLLGAGVRNGAAPDDVYRRSFVTVWTALSKGVPFAAAVAAGFARATATAQTDVALTTRAAAVAYGERDDRITGWSRVADDGCCDLCALASTQRYGGSDLMPIHDRCGCTVEPILSSDSRSSLGHVIDPERLAEIKAGGTSVAVHDHGELGPVLAQKGDTFTGPDDLDE